MITGAGHPPNVVGLVYIAAFARDEGDGPGRILGRKPSPAGAHVRPDQDGFLWIDRAFLRKNLVRIWEKPRRW